MLFDCVFVLLVKEAGIDFRKEFMFYRVASDVSDSGGNWGCREGSGTADTNPPKQRY